MRVTLLHIRKYVCLLRIFLTFYKNPYEKSRCPFSMKYSKSRYKMGNRYHGTLFRRFMLYLCAVIKNIITQLQLFVPRFR